MSISERNVPLKGWLTREKSKDFKSRGLKKQNICF